MCWVVTLVEAYYNIFQLLEVLILLMIVKLWVNKWFLDHHVELIDLTAKFGSNLLSEVAQSMEECHGNIMFLRRIRVHVVTEDNPEWAQMSEPGIIGLHVDSFTLIFI